MNVRKRAVNVWEPRMVTPEHVMTIGGPQKVIAETVKIR